MKSPKVPFTFFLALVALIAFVLTARMAWASSSVKTSSASPLNVVDLSVKTFDNAPALALTFSEPLDLRRDMSRFIQVYRCGKSDQTITMDYDGDENAGVPQPVIRALENDASVLLDGLVSGSWVSGDNPRLLYFQNIEAETKYCVHVGKGIRAASRRVPALRMDYDYSVMTPSIMPSFYFASHGTVLPAKQNGGLPVVTVNVNEVDIQFLRVKPENMTRFLSHLSSWKGWYWNCEDHALGSVKGSINDYQLNCLRKYADSVYTGRFLTPQKRNHKGVTFIPVKDMKVLSKPGIYIAVMTRPGVFERSLQTTYFYTTNLGVSIKVFGDNSDVYVNRLSDGKPAPGATVTLQDKDGAVLEEEHTDATGHAHFSQRYDNAATLVAKLGKDVSMIAFREPALDLSEYPVSGAKAQPVKIFAYSGRDLYRPGEHFQVSALLRDEDGNALRAQPIFATLKNPKGETVSTAPWQPQAGFDGYYQHGIEIPKDAPTGLWRLELKADPANADPVSVFTYHVEEFLPEKMKLDLEATAPSLDPDHGFDIDVTGNYLYGAPANGNAITGSVQMSRNANPFPDRFPGFSFGDDREDAHYRDDLPQQKLDAKGKAQVSVPLVEMQGKVSPFAIRATLSLLGAGGRPVTRSIERTYWPREWSIGVRPLFTDTAKADSPASFEVLRANAKGELSGGKFNVRLYSEDNYYRISNGQGGWTWSSDELVYSTVLTLPPHARGKLTVPVKDGRYRLEISDEAEGQTDVYRFWAGWWWDDDDNDELKGSRPDRITMRWNQPAFQAGDTAKLTVLPPADGECLITVDGDRTLFSKIVHVSKKGSVVSIPVGKDWNQHNLYASATMLRGTNLLKRHQIFRAMGLIYLPLDRSSRKLSVALDAPQKIKPLSTLKVKVHVEGLANQKAMVTLSVVDEGILNITRFKTPDPFHAFFNKERYGADVYDVYGKLIEKFAGKKGRLKFGGDSQGKQQEDASTTRQKVQIVDLFSQAVALDANGDAEITFKIPDFNGKLRLMAVAATADRFGNAERDVTVAAPLIAELSMPRFLNIGDESTFALDLRNLSGAAQKFSVEIKAGKGLVIVGKKLSVSLADKERQILRFKVDAKDAYGLVPVDVDISGKDISFTRRYALEVEAPTPRRSDKHLFSLAPGATKTIAYPRLEGFIESTVLAHLSVSSKPPIDISSALAGLLHYPYGCAEQTTSSAYPFLYVDETIGKSLGLDASFTDVFRKGSIAHAMEKLQGYQAPSGGFSIWGNASHVNYWLSAYVTDFLLDAEANHFPVPETMRKNAMAYLLKNLQGGVYGLSGDDTPYTWGYWDNHFPALVYGAFVLSRREQAPLSALKKLFEMRKQARTGLDLVRLGIAFHLMGDDDHAQTLLDESVGVPQHDEDEDWWSDSYDSSLSDQAMMYALIQRYQVKVKNPGELLLEVANKLNQERWLSTQEQFAVFLAGRQIYEDELSSKDASWSLTAEAKDHSGWKASADASQSVIEVRASDLKHGITLRNTGGKKLYIELAIEGNDPSLSGTPNPAVVIDRYLYDENGARLDRNQLKVGESAIIEVNAYANASIHNALIVDKIPAGLEIENTDIVDGEGWAATPPIDQVKPADAMQNPDIEHVEYRDDRFVAAVNLERKQAIKLFYRVKAVTPGVYVFPQSYCEDMYRPEIFAVGDPEKKFEVKERGE